MKLTKTRVDKLRYRGDGNRRVVAWCGELRGFGCRVYPSGRKAFVVSYRINGVKRMMTIGDYGVFTVDEARKEAREALRSAAKDVDPLEAKKTRCSELTFQNLCYEYLEKHAKTHKKSWAQDERKIKTILLNPEKCKFSGRHLNAITRKDIRTLHESMRDTPYQANRTLALLSTMFDYAAKNDWLPSTGQNPAHGVRKFKEEKRDRWVKPEELTNLFAALENEENIFIKAAVWLYLLTGVRKSELLKARWKDIDFNRGEWRLPDTKSGRVHYLPLSQAAIGVLKTIPKGQSNPYIIQGRISGGHLVNIGCAWGRIRTEAGLEDVRLHDLRRTVGSWLANDGASLPLIGKVLNHSNASTTQIYAHLSADPMKSALEKHGENILHFARLESDN